MRIDLGFVIEGKAAGQDGSDRGYLLESRAEQPVTREPREEA